MKNYIIILTLICLFSLTARSQSVNITQSLPLSTCIGVEKTYYANIASYTGGLNCINYYWTTSGNGTITSYSADQSTITVMWNSGISGTVYVSAQAGDGGFEDPSDPNPPTCPNLSVTDDVTITLSTAASGTINTSTDLTGYLCSTESANISATVTGDAVFDGWYQGSTQISTQLNHSISSPGVYVAKATLSSVCGSETISDYVTISAEPTLEMGTAIGDRTLYIGKPASGEMRIINSNAFIDQWMWKQGSGNWEVYSLVSQGSNHGLTYTDLVITEITKFKARVVQACSGNPTQYLPEITLTPIEYVADYNSITSTQYDENGMIGKSVSYFDQAGRNLQSQSLNVAENEVFASQPIYDDYDRPAGQTQSAPIDRSTFGFKEEFATIDGNDLIESDWKSEQPKALDKSTVGTLGHFYSENNPEPIAETAYPYAASEFYDDGSGEQKTGSQPGDYHFLKSDNNGVQKNLPVMNDELQHYELIRQKLIGQSTELNRLIKQVVIDANDNQTISYMDASGNVIASAMGSGGSEEEFSHTVEPKKSFEFHQSVSINNSLSYEDILTGSSVSGTKPAGLYRYANEGTSNVVISTKLTYSNWAYNFYDNKGRLVASMTPKGVHEVISMSNSQRNALTASTLPFTKLYSYDFKGRLVSMTEPDAGPTTYKYRKDGQIRFSQEANQTGSTFSYIDYDDLGRPIESGECDCSMSFSSVVPDSYIVAGTKRDWIKIYYDKDVITNLPSELDAYETQEFVEGAVACIESEQIQSWYSYDEQGRVTWFLQYMKDLDKYFLVEYSYDFLGNVTKVSFQPQTYCASGCPIDHVNEAYWHYYSYDANKRLITVETSVKPDQEKYLHATYEYYKNGQLARIELAENMQGIDYTYTPQGWLKSINHPDRGSDPGEDGHVSGQHPDFHEDLFGMTLEYFEGDFAKNNVNIGSLELDETQVPQQYNGNIRATVFGESDSNGYLTDYQQMMFYDYPQTLDYSNTLSSNLTANAESSITLSDGFDSNGKTVTLKVTPDVPATIRTAEVDKGEVYTYTYDGKYQLDEADYSVDGTNTNSYDVSVDGYDENGNIDGIERYGDDTTSPRDNFDFTYYANTNRLKSVSGYISDVDYNARGQVTSIQYHASANKQSISIEYDVTGKVTRVLEYNTTNVLVEFAYDDRGFRLMKRVGNIENWYIRDASGQVLAIYNGKADDQNNEIAQIELPIYGATRLGMAYKNPDHYKYIYELTDHLGNVRAIVTKLGLQATASMEVDADTNGIDEYEAQYFDNLNVRQLDAGNSYNGQYTAHTHSSEPVGPTTTLQVKAGDKINLEVFVKYNTAGLNSGTLTGGIGDLLDNNVNDAAVGVEGGALSNAVTTNIASVLAGVTTSSNEPRAYLQYILFNESFAVVDQGYAPVEAGTADANGWKQLAISDEVTQDGYLYAYVVNESNIDIYFDDFTFQILGTRAIRKADYYPFGAVAKFWKSDEQNQQETYRHDYQGQYTEKDTLTGWNVFQLRMYDPLIGRWLQVDPYGQHASPYLSMGNNPVMRTDPDGGLDDIYYKDGEEAFRIVNDKPDRYFELSPNDEFSTGFEAIEIFRNPIVDPSALASNHAFGNGYFYTANDLRVRMSLLTEVGTNNIITQAMLRWESQGNFQPLSGVEYSKQYIKRFDTNSALFMAVEEGYFGPPGVRGTAATLQNGLARFGSSMRSLTHTRMPNQRFSVLQGRSSFGSGITTQSKSSWHRFLNATRGRYHGPRANEYRKADYNYFMGR